MEIVSDTLAVDCNKAVFLIYRRRTKEQHPLAAEEISLLTCSRSFEFFGKLVSLFSFLEMRWAFRSMFLLSANLLSCETLQRASFAHTVSQNTVWKFGPSSDSSSYLYDHPLELYSMPA